jgi:penicillin-binding protein 2
LTLRGLLSVASKLALGASLALFGCRGARSPSAPDGGTAASLQQSDVAAELERAAERVLAESELPAAAALVSPSGQTLALGRSHGIDPSTFAARPGSTVKPLLAWIAAGAGVLPAPGAVACDGTYPGGFRCPGVHGALDLPSAIEASCNVYFFDLAARVGLERIVNGFAGFGLPAPARGAKRENQELLVGTGHGPLAVTPIELARAYAKLLARLRAESSGVEAPARGQILDGMRRVVTGEHGTGRRAAVAGLEVAGKTGTAEGGAYADGRRDATLPDNSWFVGFAPADAPELFVAVVVVGGGPHGAAAPLAGRIFERVVKR